MMKSVLIVLVVILVLAGGFYYYHKTQLGINRGLGSSSPVMQEAEGTNATPTSSTSQSTPGSSNPQAGNQTSSQNKEISLTITDPANNLTVSSSVITVAGKTVSNAEVFVNDSELTADAQGNFSTQVTLDEGQNIIVVTANDANGNNAEQDITVTLSSQGE